MFRKGENKTFTFNLPCDAEDLTAARISFTQKGIEKLYKTLSTVTASGTTLTYTLTEAESLAFDTGILRVQLEMRTESGRTAFDEIFECVEKTLNGGNL